MPDVGNPPEYNRDYRKSPFIIQAACSGNVEIIKKIRAVGGNIDEVGHIALTKARRNSVKSNVIGAAAYFGRVEMLNFLLGKVDSSLIEKKAEESSDRYQSKSGPFKTELHDFTPLQLAIASPYSNVNTVRILFSHRANQKVVEASSGNNILHLAVKHCGENTEILNYVIKNAGIDIFARNSSGETAISMARSRGNAKACEIIEEC